MYDDHQIDGAMIVNPRAGNFSLGIMARILQKCLDKIEDNKDFVFSVSRDYNVLKSNPKWIALLGGDGTLYHMTKYKGLIYLVPAGTFNVVHREIKRKGLKDSKVCIGKANGKTFVVAVSVGYCEQLVIKTTRWFNKKLEVIFKSRLFNPLRILSLGLFGFFFYLYSVWFTSATNRKINVTIDGEFKGTFCHITVCNTSLFGGGQILAPDADLATDEYKVWCVKGGSRWIAWKLVICSLLRYLFKSNRMTKDDVVFTGKNIKIEGEFDEYHTDGDYHKLKKDYLVVKADNIISVKIV